jgi:RND family efflux transporter MFP subunit
LSAVSGNVDRLMFSAGSEVVRGQPLAVVDTKIQELELQKAASNTRKLKGELQTYTELYQGKAATEEKLTAVRQLYTDAVNDEAKLRKQIAHGTLRSPISGVIRNKSLEEGTYADAGAEIARVLDLSRLKVLVNLTETEIYQVKHGQRISLATEVYPEKHFWGTVTFIAPQSNGSGNYPVEITLNNDPRCYNKICKLKYVNTFRFMV